MKHYRQYGLFFCQKLFPCLAFSICCGILLHSGNVNAALTDGLVAYYPFNGNANDESGNGSNGAVNGARLTTDRFGNTNSAYSFDGNSSIDVTNVSITGNNPRSIFTWIKTGSVEGIPISLGYTAPLSANSSFALGIYGSAWVLFGDYIEYDEYEITVAKNVIDNQWHYVGVTYDGINTLTLFADGVQVGQRIRDNSKSYSTVRGAVIGTWSDRNRYFNGEIDDIRIYNRVLSASEIRQLYQKTPDSQSQYLDITAIPDINGDGQNDNAVLSMKNNQFYLQTIDGVTGKLLKSASLGSTSHIQKIIALTVEDDANANGYKEIGILFTHKDGGNFLSLVDGFTFKTVRVIKLPK